MKKSSSTNTASQIEVTVLAPSTFPKVIAYFTEEYTTNNLNFSVVYAEFLSHCSPKFHFRSASCFFFNPSGDQ